MNKIMERAWILYRFPMPEDNTPKTWEECLQVAYNEETGTPHPTAVSTQVEIDNIPATLRSLREEQGLSLINVAHDLGYNSASTIGHFERKLRKPSIETISQMFDLLGYDMVITIHKKNGGSNGTSN